MRQDRRPVGRDGEQRQPYEEKANPGEVEEAQGQPTAREGHRGGREHRALPDDGSAKARPTLRATVDASLTEVERWEPGERQ